MNARSGRLAPGDEQIAPSAVEFGQRQALHPALGRGADFRHLHERIPQPLAVDLNICAHARTPLFDALMIADWRTIRAALQGPRKRLEEMSSITDNGS